MNKTAYQIISIAVVFGLALGAVSPALASATFGPAVQAKVYYVSTTGSDTNPGTSAAPFRTFAKAVSVLAPGDTLQVMPGTYNETLRLTASGTAAAPITVIGNGALVNVQRTQNNGIKILGSYVNLSNFEVIGALDAGIAIPGKYVTVKNNVLHDNVTQNGVNRNCGVAGSWNSALKVMFGADHITLEGNTVYENCGEGIAITRGMNVVVQNNTVYDNSAPNIYVDNSPYSTVRNNLVYCTGAVLNKDGKRPIGIALGEELYDGWGAQMHDVLVEGNTIRDCGKGIAAFESDVGGTLTNVTITRNYIPSGTGGAISLTTESNYNVVISYNTLFKAPWTQVSAGVTMIGNIIIGSTAPTPTAISSPTRTAAVPTFTPISTLPAATNTAVPVASNTATPAPAFTSTPLPVASSTPTGPPAATQPVADAIFASGFESGGFADWSANANGGGDLSVSPSAALVGANGLQAVINDDTVMYVSDDRPNAEPRYRARFYFDPNSIAMANGDTHNIFRGFHGGSTVALRVVFAFSGGAYQIRAGLVNDGTAFTETNWFTISDAPHVIELDWRAATGAGANNGGLTLWVDGVQGADLIGIDNDTRRIDSVRLGALAGIDTGTRGTYYFDAFDSRRQSYIGP